ncbi:family 20 glycosylhydrolase [Vibrio lentus]|nr:family 20 glycosylhydrolase [Vibrio lentus]
MGAWRGPDRALEPPIHALVLKTMAASYAATDSRSDWNYAEQRSITVIPEIDIPGDTVALRD